MPSAVTPIRRLSWLSALLLLAAMALTALAAGPAAAQQEAPARTLRITSALAAFGDGDTFPAGVQARSVVLPDDWSTRTEGGGPVWYRVGFNAPASLPRDDLTAVYVERACTTIEVYLNGQIVHSGGRLVQPMTNHCGQPQLVTLPSALIAPGLNTLDIKVAGMPLAEVGSRWRAGSLSRLELGPLSQLMPRYEGQRTVAVALPQALSATLLLMGGFMFVLGFINRKESHLAYFGALSIGWALLDARLWLRTLPIERGVAEFLMTSLLAFITLAAVQFLLRYAHHRSRLVDRLLPLQCVLMPASLALAGTARLHTMATLWTLVFAVQVTAAAVFYLRAQWRAGSRASWVMAATLATLALAALVDFLGQQLGGAPATSQVVRLVAPLMFVVIGLRLVQQHGRALQEAELGRAHLEQRVRDATAEIEQNFRQLAELRVEQVTERERKRIAADLHDDLGAKLLTIVHTTEEERISTLAREALEEMRLSVRGLTGKAVRLADALGDWRAEVVNRLAQAGMMAEWSAPEDLPQTLSARAFVQTTRILREATSNIIKHSGATHCSVTCRVADGDFQLVIQDDGQGIPMEMDGRLDRGHGMATMKNRAKQLQGQCLVESSPGYGTVIRLTIPLERALEAAAR